LSLGKHAREEAFLIQLRFPLAALRVIEKILESERVYPSLCGAEEFLVLTIPLFVFPLEHYSPLQGTKHLVECFPPELLEQMQPLNGLPI
jgi:hypothetical protein